MPLITQDSFGTRAGASERGGLSRGLAQADAGPGVYLDQNHASAA